MTIRWGSRQPLTLNLLARINRELDADFVLEQFERVARFNPDSAGVEMHLRSSENRVWTIPRVTVSVEGETVWTESSHKYCPEELSQIAKTPAFSARHSGLTRNGLLRKPVRNRVSFWVECSSGPEYKEFRVDPAFFRHA